MNNARHCHASFSTPTPPGTWFYQVFLGVLRVLFRARLRGQRWAVLILRKMNQVSLMGSRETCNRDKSASWNKALIIHSEYWILGAWVKLPPLYSTWEIISQFQRVFWATTSVRFYYDTLQYTLLHTSGTCIPIIYLCLTTQWDQYLKKDRGNWAINRPDSEDIFILTPMWSHYAYLNTKQAFKWAKGTNWGKTEF